MCVYSKSSEELEPKFSPTAQIYTLVLSPKRKTLLSCCFKNDHAPSINYTHAALLFNVMKIYNAQTTTKSISCASIPLWWIMCFELKLNQRTRHLTRYSPGCRKHSKFHPVRVYVCVCSARFNCGRRCRSGRGSHMI